MSIQKDTKLIVDIKPTWILDQDSVDKMIPIKYLPLVYNIYLNQYIKTYEWQQNLEYIFERFQESYTPYYGDIIYDLSQIHTHITPDGLIRINGIFKPKTKHQIRQLYEKSDGLNKTWTDHGKQYLTQKKVIDNIKEALWKMCYEGEIHISGLPGRVVLNLIKYQFIL